MATVVDSLLIQLGLDAQKFEAGLAKAQTQMRAFSSKVKATADNMLSGSASFGLWSAAAVTGAAVAAAAITKAGIEIGASIQDMADQLNFSAVEYRAFSDSAEEAGLQLGKFNKAILAMNSNVNQASLEGGAAADAFSRVGLSLSSLSTADSAERIRLVADAVSKATTQTEKLSIATAAFGEQGGRMVKWLDQGREGLEASAAGFKAVHGAVDAVSFAKLQEGRNALGDINDVLDSVKMKFAEAMVPAIVAARDEIEKFIASSDGLSAVRTKTEDIGKAFAKIGGDFTQGVAIIYNELGELVAQMGTGVYQIVRVFATAGVAVADVFSRPIQLINKLWQEIVSNINAQAAALVGTLAELADAAGIEGVGEKLHGVSAALQKTADAAAATSSSIASIDTSTPALDTLIEDGRAIADSFRSAASELKDNASEFGSWGTQAVEAIEKVTTKVDELAAVRAAADEKQRQADKDLADQQEVNRQKTLAGAQAMYDQLAGMATTAYDIMFNSELAYIAERERLRQESLESYRTGLLEEQAALQSRLDVENEIRSGSNEGKALAEQSLSNRILEIQTKEMEEERAIQENTAAIWEASMKGKLDLIGGFMGQMSQLMQSNNRKMFEVGKAAAIGEAVINTYKAANAAYASMAGIPVVGPALGAAAAAAAVVAGVANVQKIKSTPFGGGGATGGSGFGAGATGGGGNGVNGVPSPEQGNGGGQTINRVFNISLGGDGRQSNDSVRALIAQINDAVDDNTTLRVA